MAEVLELRLRDVKNMSMYDLRKAIADHDKTAWVLYGKAGCSIVPVCDCKHPASIFAVSKAGRNNGKLFWVCRKERDDPTRCNFFQWDEQWRANRNTAAAAEPPASAAAAEPPAAAAAEPPAETTYEPEPETRRSNVYDDPSMRKGQYWRGDWRMMCRRYGIEACLRANHAWDAVTGSLDPNRNVSDQDVINALMVIAKAKPIELQMLRDTLAFSMTPGQLVEFPFLCDDDAEFTLALLNEACDLHPSPQQP